MGAGKRIEVEEEKAKGMTDCQRDKIIELGQYIKNGEIKAKSCCPQCKSTIIEKDQKTRLESCIFCSEGVPFPKNDKDLLEDRAGNKGKNKGKR